MAKTQTRQTQIAPSNTIDDALPLGYNNIDTLEEDLNYLRSIIRDLKGTVAYDSPLVKNLEDLASDLAAATFNNATLTGAPTATTPPVGNISTRIATTEFVSQALVNVGADAAYTYTQPTPASTWEITHNLGKYPSVTIVSSAKEIVVGEILYNNGNSITITLASSMSGVAYLN